MTITLVHDARARMHHALPTTSLTETLLQRTRDRDNETGGDLQDAGGTGGASNGKVEVVVLGDALRSNSGSGCSGHSKTEAWTRARESGMSVLGGTNEGGANGQADGN